MNLKGSGETAFQAAGAADEDALTRARAWRVHAGAITDRSEGQGRQTQARRARDSFPSREHDGKLPEDLRRAGTRSDLHHPSDRAEGTREEAAFAWRGESGGHEDGRPGETTRDRV